MDDQVCEVVNHNNDPGKECNISRVTFADDLVSLPHCAFAADEVDMWSVAEVARLTRVRRSVQIS